MKLEYKLFQLSHMGTQFPYFHFMCDTMTKGEYKVKNFQEDPYNMRAIISHIVP